MNQISYVVRKYSREKMRDIDMNAALLHHWFCAALHLCSGKTQVCSEQGKPGKKYKLWKRMRPIMRSSLLVRGSRGRDLDWWIANVSRSFFPRHVKPPSAEIHTYVSSSGGWGAVHGSICTSGKWTTEEKNKHINDALELLAIAYGLICFEKEVTGQHDKELCDSPRAVAHIKNMGGSRSVECDEIARRVWTWCLRGI